MKSTLLLFTAILLSLCVAGQYEIPAGELSAGVHSDVSDPLGTTVSGIIWRKGAVRYNHTNHKFTVNNGGGWLTQFNEGPAPDPWGTTSTNTDYFSFPGTSEIAGEEGIITFDTVHFDNGAGNIMHITNHRQGMMDQYGEVSGGILVGRALYFANGITTTDRQHPVKSAIVFVNSAFYAGGNTDAQHVDGFVSEANYLFGNNLPVGHGGDFTYPVGNATETYPLRRQGTFDEEAYLIAVGWVDGDPNTTNDPTKGGVNSTGFGFLGAGIQAVVPVGFWDWHVQDGTNQNPDGSPFKGAETLAQNQTITVSIPALDGMLSGANASDLRLVGYDADNDLWINLGTAGASGLTKGSLLSGTITTGTRITALAIGSITNIILPVTFSSFTVKAAGCSALLEWETATEQNNSHFVVERSIDGTTFAAIGRVNGAGTSNHSNQYTFTDKTPASGINYYRITQTDFDGKYSSSEIQAVRINCSEQVPVHVYPNPASNRVYIQSRGKSVAQINVVATNGQTVKKYRPAQNQGSTLSLDIQTIPQGIYLLQIVNRDGTVDIVKMLKK